MKAVATLWASISLVLAACASSPGSRPASSAGSQDLIGSACRFAVVEYRGRSYHVPARLGAQIRLSDNGAYAMNDSVNLDWGKYVSTPRGFKVTETGGTDVGLPLFQPDAVRQSPRAVLAAALTKLQYADEVVVSRVADNVELKLRDFTLRCNPRPH